MVLLNESNQINCRYFFIAYTNFICGFKRFNFYKLNDINPQKTVPENEHGRSSLDTLWVSTGEVKSINIKSYSAVGYMFGFAKLAIGINYENYRDAFPVGSSLTGLVARDIVSKLNIKQNWHLNNMVVSIWVSNNYSSIEALNYLLSSMYYGYDNYSFLEAAKFYFGKKESQLNLSEIISLIAITHAPSRYNPYCNKDRLLQRGMFLNKQLAKYNEKIYGNVIFKVPKFSDHSEIVCKNI